MNRTTTRASIIVVNSSKPVPGSKIVKKIIWTQNLDHKEKTIEAIRNLRWRTIEMTVRIFLFFNCLHFHQRLDMGWYFSVCI